MPIKIYKRGEIWHYRGTVAGRLLRGSTKTARKEIAQRIAAEHEAHHWKGHLDGPASVLTFAQAAMLYRAAGKQDRFLRPIEDHWKDTPVKAINAGAIRQSAITLYPTAGPATRNRQAIVPTQAIINHAAEQELCPRIRVARFPVARKAKAPATWEWVQAFMASATKPNLAALACFMFLTGARISQALAVTWQDVDFKARRVRIRATAKGDDDRLAHMPAELIAALANIGSERKGSVFEFKSRGNCKTQWAGAIKRAGIAFLSYHRCRHGFATGLLDKGVSPFTVRPCLRPLNHGRECEPVRASVVLQILRDRIHHTNEGDDPMASRRGMAMTSKPRKDIQRAVAAKSWYCDQCHVEVYERRCPHCGKTEREHR